MLILPVVLPLLAGAVLPFAKIFRNRKACNLTVFITVMATFIFAAVNVCGEDKSLVIWYILKDVPVYLKLDALGKIFYMLTAAMWIFAAVFSFEYTKHEHKEPRYYSMFLMTLAVLMGISSAGNLVTMYMFYEGMSVTTLGLIIHSQTKEAIKAGHKHIFYSIGGALLGLLGIFYVYAYTGSVEFTAGGLFSGIAPENTGLLLVICLVMIIGFGSKAGMFPLHGWLSAAHPVAPAPASAVLSGNITKMGVLAIIRVIYYIAGVDFIKGTWVQYTFMILALITVFMGSMLAYKEKVLKKRLAYSTVSQVSYILFGISLMNPVGFLGAMLHVVFHSIVKNTLFLSAGAVIYRTGKTKVSELAAIGKQMPVTMWCFTLVSITLVGIPPTSAFVSKWYLALGAMNTNIGWISYLGPIILLISALLTAGYLLSITIKGFYPGEDFDMEKAAKAEPNLYMLLPMLVLTAAAVFFGIYPKPLTDVINVVIDVLF